MDEITIKPIGTIRTQYFETLGMPIQAALAQSSVLAVAILDEDFMDGLKDLEQFTHIILVYWFHKARPFQLLQKPFVEDTLRGIFSIRSPHRPNPIGISVVELVKIEKNHLYFNHADMLDGTPLLDIKPFVPALDNRPNAGSGWTEGKFDSTLPPAST